MTDEPFVEWRPLLRDDPMPDLGAAAKAAGSITFDDLTAAFRAIEQQPYRPPQYVVSPADGAWIRNPVGRAPSWLAIDVAMRVGAISGDHPEVQRLIHALFGDSTEPDGGEPLTGPDPAAE